MSPPVRVAWRSSRGSFPGPPAANPSLTPAQLGNVMNGIDQIQPWQEEFYKDLHRHPDVWGEEARTAEKVTRKLQEIGADEILQIGGGVVGVIRNGDGRRVLFRADMDALPVTEATGLDYASTEPGKMHACGHDTHVAKLAGAARLLAERRSELAGRVVFMFQPGEEGFHGARYMLDERLLDVGPLADGTGSPIAGAFALHISSMFPSGTINLRGGTQMASSDVV